MTCSSVACSVGVGSGDGEITHSLLYSQPFHQSEELPPLMGAIGKQWDAARGQKEAEHCWCGRIAAWKTKMNHQRADGCSCAHWSSPSSVSNRQQLILC